MPKPVEKLSIEEIKKEINYIERQIAAGKVGTPNVHVRLASLRDELVKREKCDVEIEISEGNMLKLIDLLETLQKKGENVKTDNDVITYLLNKYDKWSMKVS